MEIRDYPALSDGRTHLDVAACFPSHRRVIAAAEQAMKTLGVPGKGNYSNQATLEADQLRSKLAKFLGVNDDEIFFCHSATQAARDLVNLARQHCQAVIYSPEDHKSNAAAAHQTGLAETRLEYDLTGRYTLPSSTLPSPHSTLFLATHLHGIYGLVTGFEYIIEALHPKVTILDISQSVGRLPLHLDKMPIAAAYFSAQKLGGLAGLGVVYIKRSAQDLLGDLTDLEPNTLPLHLLAGLSAALDVLEDIGMARIYGRLADLTGGLVLPKLGEIAGLSFSKGVAHHDTVCGGCGIVSFKLNGYSAQDVGMILDDANINVRAGDHCLAGSLAERDWVRLSWHVFTPEEDLHRALHAINEL